MYIIFTEKATRRARGILQEFLTCYAEKRYLCALNFPGLMAGTRGRDPARRQPP
jgi:hypothetical protein